MQVMEHAHAFLARYHSRDETSMVTAESRPLSDDDDDDDDD
jgi:hypothetical protein